METENKNYLERIGQSIKRSVTLKLFSIFILMMLLLIPLSFVESLIEERQQLREVAITEVSNKWANDQEVYGPILTIPVSRRIVSDDVVKVIRDELHILPSDLEVKGAVSPKTLHRGIYEVAVYDARLSFSGRFDSLTHYLNEFSELEAHYEDAFLTVHVSDLRGIKEKVLVRWNDLTKEVTPGSGIPAIISSGVTVKHILDADPAAENSFNFDLDLQGSQFLGFVPLGKETRVAISSDWQDPGFDGAFLPVEREVSDAGFTARWKVLELNRNYPQFWLGNRNTGDLKQSAFGVNLLLPANDYRKSMRSVKYALLAISLTFLTFFLVEIFNRRKLHPLQYIMIGLALVLFYTLLVSISEHTNFNTAYLISGITIISIIALYARAILQSTKQTLVLVIILCFTYAFVYVTLQLQDYALLIGSIGLTAILAFTMYITRKINWYSLSSGKQG
tara:strand:+ start:24871 stop:26217 length:1347 start_codon:yes stop_codon:yes gene_type:complete